MVNYIIRRLLILPVVLFGVTLFVFTMTQLLTPYERASLYVADIPKRVGALDEIIEKYGLDDPPHVQYWRWMSKVLHGDLGFSKRGKRPVSEALLHFLPATAELAIWSAIPILWGGIQLGVLSALHHNKFFDHISRVFSIVGWSLPIFVVGLVLLMIFYAKLDWFPAGRLSDWANNEVLSDHFVRYTQMNTFDALLNLRFDILLDAARHLVLPVISLSYLDWALIQRVTRSSMLEVLRQDYVTTARAKGLSERDVIQKHARPNAMIPVATIGGLTVIALMNGLVITETVFNYRGLGWFAADSALHLDVISVLGFTMFSGVLMVVANLVVDILYAVLDPRVRLG
jgi:peptide/nickel transport system permease protein